MTNHAVPNDIVLKAFSVFRDGNRKTDKASLYAINEFFAYIENGELSPSKARKLLLNDKAVSDFIEEQRESLNVSKKSTLEEIISASKALLEKTHTNSEKTLAGQDEMRTELRELIDELDLRIKAVKEATAANEATAKTIGAQVTALGTEATNIHKEVKKAVKNTSTITAVLVGLGVGIIGGLPSSYVYERFLSVSALAPQTC